MSLYVCTCEHDTDIEPCTCAREPLAESRPRIVASSTLRLGDGSEFAIAAFEHGTAMLTLRAPGATATATLHVSRDALPEIAARIMMVDRRAIEAAL